MLPGTVVVSSEPTFPVTNPDPREVMNDWPTVGDCKAGKGPCIGPFKFRADAWPHIPKSNADATGIAIAALRQFGSWSLSALVIFSFLSLNSDRTVPDNARYIVAHSEVFDEQDAHSDMRERNDNRLNGCQGLRGEGTVRRYGEIS